MAVTSISAQTRQQVFELKRQGLTDSEIARRLHISQFSAHTISQNKSYYNKPKAKEGVFDVDAYYRSALI